MSIIDKKATILSRPGVLIGTLIGLSTIVRSLVAWQHPTPVFVPDEFIYSGLARGIAETGMPVYLGQSLDLPAVLTAYLTAPFWLLSDTTLAYHLVQSEGALAFSLAAIPVYLLARRLSLSTNTALLLAAGTLVLPDLALSSLLVSEPFAFLLFSFTFWAGHRALLSVRRLSDQLLFLVLLAALCLTRTQFIVLPVAYFVALLTQGLLDQRLRETLRAQLPLLVTFVSPIPIMAVIGLSRALGFYTAIGDFLTPAPSVFLDWLLLNLLILALSCGWLLAPGALLGIVVTLRAPRDRAERSFTLLLLPTLLGLLAQATIISAQVKDAQGRYLIYLLPLLLIQFALAARRGLLLRWPHAVGLLALAPIALLSPIFELNRTSLNSAPILLSRHKLEQLIGIPDTYASVPFLLAGLAVVTLYAWWKRSLSAIVALSASFLIAAAVGGSFGQRLLATDKLTPSHRPFLARTQIERTLLLVGPSSSERVAMSTVFWNREITRVVSLGRLGFGSLPVDVARTATDGTLLVDGKPYTGPLLVDKDALSATLRGVEASETSADVLLFHSAEAPVQFRTLVTGLAGSAFGQRGSLQAWPPRQGAHVRGNLTFSLSLPARLTRPVVIVFRLPRQPPRTVSIEPGRTQTVSLTIRSEGVWRGSYSARGTGYRSGGGYALVGLRHLTFRFESSSDAEAPDAAAADN